VALSIFRLYRAPAHCQFQQGKKDETVEPVIGIDTGFQRSAEGTLQSNLDLIIFYSADSNTKTKAIELPRSVFFDAETKLNRDQASAFHRRLSALNATHFTHKSIVHNPLPITVVGNVGGGAYAIVEAIEISSRHYSRKSISLPRYNQTSVRQIIQNEISVIRSLTHPQYAAPGYRAPLSSL